MGIKQGKDKNINMKKKISEAVIKRLPRYYRCLTELEQEGLDRISSHALSVRMGVTASQIRQDLNCFGGFGQQGYGYKVQDLRAALRNLIGLDRTYSVIILGAGNIGQALANYSGFDKEGFYVKAMFDVNVSPTHRSPRNIPLYHIDLLEKYLQSNKTDIAVISVTQSEAQNVANRLVNADVKYIWNFTPKELTVPPDVTIENVHLSDSLFILSYRSRENAAQES